MMMTRDPWAQEIWRTELISDRELNEFLEKKHNKPLVWRHMLRRRHPTLFPAHRIIKPPVKFIDPQTGRERIIGRTGYYHRTFRDYLTHVITLHETERLSYAAIAKRSDIQQEREQLERLMEAELYHDKRGMRLGFRENFLAATAVLTACFEWSTTSSYLQFCHHLAEDVRKQGQVYFRLSRQMRAPHLSKAQYQALQRQREAHGRQIDLCHGLMEAVIKQAASLVKKGVCSKTQLVNAVVQAYKER